MSQQIIFFVLAAFSIISALMVVFNKNPIYSVLWLVACFFSIAGHFIMLNAEFLAIVHIIVYSGAIMVLMLFTVMLLNLNKQTEPHKSNLFKIGAIFSGGLLLLVLLAAFKTTTLPAYATPQNPDLGSVKNIGRVIYTEYVLPFEIASILFITAMIGAVLLAKKEN